VVSQAAALLLLLLELLLLELLELLLLELLELLLELLLLELLVSPELPPPQATRLCAMNNAATTGAAHVAQRVNENRSGFESE